MSPRKHWNESMAWIVQRSTRVDHEPRGALGMD
jgi:hypothetical protein